jgi:retinoid hydroxylase
VLDEAREITFSAAAFALAGFSGGAQVEALRQLFYQQDHADHAQRDQLLQELISQRRARPDSGPPHDVLGQIVGARDDNGALLSDGQIVAHTNNLLVAGHETTTTLSAWTLYLLASLPEHRQRIEAELDALLGEPARGLEVDMLRRLQQLEQFIKEVGRLYPPVITVPRSVLRDVEFGGYLLPAGTPVRLALGASHLLPQVFAEPHRFDPDRFAVPRQEDRRTPYGLVTFGGGPRMCIGIHFAQIEIKALVVHVLRRYHVEPTDDSPPPNAGHLTALLERGIRLRIRRKRSAPLRTA